MKNFSSYNLNKFILFLVVVFVIFYSFYTLIFSSPFNFPDKIILNIENGESLRVISKNFKNENVIRSRVAFESLIIIYGGDKNIAPGDYLFDKKSSVFMVAKRIIKSDRQIAPIKVTIPEGYDNQQIGEVFSNKLKNFKKESFLDLAVDDQGYLFPDTYFFFSNDDENDALLRMKNNFNEKIKKLNLDVDKTNKNLAEIIIMASLIEREAKGDNDRALISGILWSRIDKKMFLQVDADTWTYKNKGLPQKPICNPGLKAIKAALYSTNSSYLFYLHDEDGQIYFAKNYEEHKKNINKYLK